MILGKINIVWFKRDLRTIDHEPLLQAELQNIPFLSIYIFDPKLLVILIQAIDILVSFIIPLKTLKKTIKV